MASSSRRRGTDEEEQEQHTTRQSRRSHASPGASSTAVTSVITGSTATAERDGDIASANHGDGEEDESPQEIQFGLLPHPKLTVTDQAKKVADQLGNQAIQEKAAELARLALATDYQRSVLKREDIRTKVLSASPRALSVVFNRAQKILQRTCGLHLVEVRAKGAENAEIARQAQQAAIREATLQANGLRSRTRTNEEPPEVTEEGKPNTGFWVLRSAIPPEITRKLVAVDDGLTAASSANPSSTAPGTMPSSSQSASPRRNRARRRAEPESAINWSSADRQDGEMGLLYIVLGIVLVSGRSIAEVTLQNYLRRLYLSLNTALPAALRGSGPSIRTSGSLTQSTQTQARNRSEQGSLEGFLHAMAKQSYLERVPSDVGAEQSAATQAGGNSAAGGRTTTQSRRRWRTSGLDDEAAAWEWRWGSRAEAEVSEVKIARMMCDIFLDPAASSDGLRPDADDDEETRALDRARLRERQTALMNNIASVAGSQLID
ncbi:hypothetical protein BCV70DRAFT_162241 [Testicularia cyperi]|uniref:MAGE domain-containing protein n=1 Tax=Testicularia cyperi TaxID=1882483 RepID=A0A317XNZ2_9BASI|nr:hypothetical protein BCV70DRAFT_162241 [Testicularia cyperi]